MLLFKQKFHDAIRRGEKTQTLRNWKTLHVKPGRKDVIPGVGPIMIDSVEKVLFDDLTDADAVPDGFSTAEDLKNELRDIYGDGPLNLYKIRFHLLKENEEESALPGQPARGKTTRKTSKKAKKSDTEEPSNPAIPGPDSLDLLIPRSNEPPAVVEFVMEMKREFAEMMEKFNDKWEAREYMKNHPIEDETRKLSESEVVEKMVQRCRINRCVCDWNHEPGKSKDFFDLFLRSPRNENGVPTLDGHRLLSLMRDFCNDDPDLWSSINWISYEICSAWTEWQYAVEHWLGQKTTTKKE
ncbi:MAG: ASCH domain-containing protein [Thermoguttaceae bacterium]|nr:ASCH domain-containing protein [Thermoguttaceae bacterium]